MNTKKLLLLLIAIFTYGISNAQSADDVFNLLIQKGLVKQTEADSIRAEYALNQQVIKEKQKTFGVLSSRNLSIGGYAQVRYQSLQEPGKIDGFDIRRARLDIKGAISPEWEYRLLTDFAISPKIIDANITYKPFDYLKFTAGQFLIPFSLESNTPDRDLETVDRAQVSGLVARNKDALGDQNGRDLGIQVSGSLLQTPSNRFLLDYYVAYFNGQGINLATDANNFKDVAARLVFHPFEFLDLGGSYTNGYDNWTTTAAKAIKYSATAPYTIISLPTNAITSNNNHSRIGADISATYNDFNFRAEYIEAQEGNYLVGSTTKTLIKNGWYAQAGYYVLPKKLQFVLKYDTYDPTKANPKNDITSFYTYGANYYVNNFVKFQVNYKHKSEQGLSIDKDEVVAQLQVRF